MTTSVRYNDFHLSPPREYFLPSNPVIRPGDITRRSISLAEVVNMKETHLAAERKSHEKILEQDALTRLRCEKTFDDLKQTNIRCHEQTEKVNRRIESVLAVEPRLSGKNLCYHPRLEERCEYLGKELEVAKKEKVEARRQFTECQARIEAEVAIKRASEREVSGKESLRRRIIEKDVAARRGDLERRKSQVRHERANVHQIDRKVQGLAKTDINLSSLSAGSMKTCLEKARNEFSFLQSQLVEMELAWKRLPEDRAKLFLQAQEL
ncbi:hypothetical protein Pmar_PMAR007982 [Perkinsus marinus ATCC 50983]|uniref:Uncharacterized protein n=1 Tax=Perkinsus marinus (strain ATCC 50983 / TXsc) TaxID=423536 RepID=C5LE61_PERM5|nr:hypothetical protein Pmar_PMAR007982 [Perkinsus marinus ATCC 50983]EER04982.1 hypothetical protein Pmar_PMAR007982 [Perkinsus marinus ATCC 50983]|eukprot:XP_002773166.1 hypothetical protein Pmar_PMAR007982 [Perkinsus marinus ATCC 50983]